MLTDEDVKKLIEVFVTKDDLKEAVSNLASKEDLNNLITSVDAYAKKADTYFQEMVALSHKVNRIEKWVQQIADKVGIKLDY